MKVRGMRKDETNSEEQKRKQYQQQRIGKDWLVTADWKLRGLAMNQIKYSKRRWSTTFQATVLFKHGADYYNRKWVGYKDLTDEKQEINFARYMRTQLKYERRPA